MAAEEVFVGKSAGAVANLPVAGPGTRSYAFVVDWQIRVLLALSWLLAGWVLRIVGGHGGAVALSSPLFVAVVVLPAALLYVLYHPVLEIILRGRTPGLRKAGARIVTVRGAIPGTGALLIRNAFRILDSLPVCYVVGLLCCLFTARSVRLGDLAAGTLLVLEEAAGAPSLERSGASLARGDLQSDARSLVGDLIERWPELATERRVMLARRILIHLDRTAREAELAVLSELELRSRLESLLGPSGS